jgi:hydroxypyruvate isomerase
MKDIVDRWFPTSVCKGTQKVVYNLQTLWGGMDSCSSSSAPCIGYWRRRDQLLEAMGTWISNSRSLSSRKLAASNIGFTMSPEVATTLCHWGIRYAEIAPTRCTEFGGLKPWSMQSLLYSLPLINIFTRPSTFLCHCQNLMKHGSAKGIRRYVFGCPKQRSLTTNTDDAIALFRKVGSIAAEYDSIFCIEPNAHEYGCTWLTTIEEVLEFVKAVDHPNIRINLDSGNFVMEEDPFPLESLGIEWVGHVQISAPHLRHRLSAEDIVVAKRFVRYLDSTGYTGCISFEARSPPSFHEYRKGLQDFLQIFPPPSFPATTLLL